MIELALIGFGAMVTFPLWIPKVKELALSVGGIFSPVPFHELTPEEKFARSSWATATTPDQLISAYLINLIAKDFDNWKYKTLSERSGVTGRSIFRASSLTHKPKDICISFTMTNNQFSGENDLWEHDGVKVNDTKIDFKEGKKIVQSWKTIKKQRDDIERKAAAAKRQMEEEKKKWDFAENLLGLVRLPNGALVPKPMPTPTTENDDVLHKSGPLG